MWISPRAKPYNAKIFVLGRKTEKSEEQFLKIRDAVNKDNYGIFKNDCVADLPDWNNFEEIDFDKLDCNLLVVENFSETENLDTDFLFETTFSDYLNVKRRFKLMFECIIKILENGKKI